MHLVFFAALLASISPVEPSLPNRQPQLASAPGLTAVAFGSGSSIWISTSHDNGRSFSKPTEIAHVPALALGRHRGPRVLITGRTVIVSAIAGKTAATADLLVWRSADQGASWSQPAVVNDVPAATREGLFSITSGKGSEMAAVWLDLRAPGTRLYGAFSKDAGATWSKNVALYISSEKTICQCCDPSITPIGPHQFAVMFRNALQGSRDMYVTNWTLDGAVSTPQKLGSGSWKLNACPMDGGGLIQWDKCTVTAWRRDQTVYLDEPGQPETALGDGKDVAIAPSAKGAYVAWSGAAGIRVHRPADKEPFALSTAGSFPALTELPDGSVLASWEQDGKIQLQVVR